MEIWKNIKGYEGIYEVSNYGNVKNLNTNKIMKPFDNKGYLRIGLYKNSKVKKFLIHVLVATHFISEKPFENAEVNHKDLNRKNNHIDNLEWVNGSENVNHSIENTIGRLEHLKNSMSEIGKKYNSLGTEASKKSVAQIDANTDKIIMVFESAREASRITGANYRNISQVCKGQRKTHMGYKWAFI